MMVDFIKMAMPGLGPGIAGDEFLMSSVTR